ncbi:hypothetical protein AALA17_03350 [Lactobacillaceae bacterium 24-114]
MKNLKSLSGVDTVSNTDSKTQTGSISGKNTAKVDGDNYKYMQKKICLANKIDVS